MMHIGVSKRADGKILYEPPAGLTIKEAINNAIGIAKKEKKSVELHINDIILNVNQNSNPASIATQYFYKLERNYRQSISNNNIVR